MSALRTRLDFAACLKELVNVHYPEAERILLVLDQLNTRSPASLDTAFPPAEAKRLVDTLEIHHTPMAAGSTWPSLDSARSSASACANAWPIGM